MSEGKKEYITLYCHTVKRYLPRMMPLRNSVLLLDDRTLKHIYQTVRDVILNHYFDLFVVTVGVFGSQKTVIWEVLFLV